MHLVHFILPRPAIENAQGPGEILDGCVIDKLQIESSLWALVVTIIMQTINMNNMSKDWD